MDYQYKKSNGEFIHCYGDICEDANYFVSCYDEYQDAEFYDIDPKHNTWKRVCDHIIAQMRDCDIQQIEAG